MSTTSSNPTLEAPVLRPFQRGDRDQVTDLVNAHLAAVLPGLSVPVNTVLSQLEREPDEYVVDPWVSERITLVAESQRRIVAAAYLVRYADDDTVGPDYRGAGEIRWLISWPTTGQRLDHEAIGGQLAAAAVRQLQSWQVARQFANGSLPAPAAYGVPDVWPHVLRIYEAAGFRRGREEQIVVARVPDLVQRLRHDKRRARTPWPELKIIRSVGAVGTRFSAVDSERRWGYLEIDTSMTRHSRFSHSMLLADIGNIWVEPEVRRRGVARWLLAEAVHWLELARIDLLLSYLDDTSSPGEAAFVSGLGFDHLVTNWRGWERSVTPD